jgi:thiol-disulfide isomerase/thioredoxin
MFRSHIQRMDSHGSELIVPDFAKEMEWFNSSPLSFKSHLRGKVVVLDFWTFCCINCMHVLPDLAFLEEKYRNSPVVFIGVHSPKFANEKVSENILQAVLRYDIAHPVVNDPTMSMWKSLGISSWPTFVVVGPKGNLLFSLSGEGKREELDAYIAAVLDYYGSEAFSSNPLPLLLEKNRQHEGSSLKFPGKLAVDQDGKRLFISDSNHHRIVVVSIEGDLITVIGSGEEGLSDGAYRQACFKRPQGLAYADNQLFVADTENHAIRQIDLSKEMVMTIAGNGIQGNDYFGGGIGSKQQLSSPWDIAFDPTHKQLFIAMAGTHQIWTYEMGSHRSRVFSGTGKEQNLNSENPLQAAWAQPSGLSLGDGRLFIADSESSAIRCIELPAGRTSTLVGGDAFHPNNLFSFGDYDGVGEEAKLQHPLGVLWLPQLQRLVVADSYNHRLKVLDPKTRRIEAWVGMGRSGFRDGNKHVAQFAEPSGLALAPGGREIFVADTNNHAIRKVSIATGEVTLLRK